MSATSLVTSLQDAAPLIAPSLLACDFAHLADEIRRVEDAGARVLHLDIMDGVLVPNLSFGLPVVEAIRRSTRLPLDVHLMIVNPGQYVRRFREAGADLLTFHIEAVAEPRSLLEEIRAMGCGAGITLNPPTPLESLDDCLDLCDIVLVMSVMAGFGGQTFDPIALEKLQRLRQRMGPRALLSVDGGVNAQTISACAAAGANYFVMGTALFSQPDYGEVMQQMACAARREPSDGSATGLKPGVEGAPHVAAPRPKVL
jgi:ribulose-phosphate 3-epimerase